MNETLSGRRSQFSHNLPSCADGLDAIPHVVPVRRSFVYMLPKAVRQPSVLEQRRGCGVVSGRLKWGPIRIFCCEVGRSGIEFQTSKGRVGRGGKEGMAEETEKIVDLNSAYRHK
ncbi:MAG: hypothetical protein ACLSVD_18990, partial [Eggerthellaceae bacterium]